MTYFVTGSRIATSTWKPSQNDMHQLEKSTIVPSATMLAIYGGVATALEGRRFVRAVAVKRINSYGSTELNDGPEHISGQVHCGRWA